MIDDDLVMPSTAEKMRMEMSLGRRRLSRATSLPLPSMRGRQRSISLPIRPWPLNPFAKVISPMILNPALRRRALSHTNHIQLKPPVPENELPVPENELPVPENEPPLVAGTLTVHGGGVLVPFEATGEVDAKIEDGNVDTAAELAKLRREIVQMAETINHLSSTVQEMNTTNATDPKLQIKQSCCAIC